LAQRKDEELFLLSQGADVSLEKRQRGKVKMGKYTTPELGWRALFVEA
jgi:hypothetical protein